MSNLTLVDILSFVHKYCTLVQEGDKERFGYFQDMKESHQIIMVAGISFYMPKNREEYGKQEHEVIDHINKYCNP